MCNAGNPASADFPFSEIQSVLSRGGRQRYRVKQEVCVFKLLVSCTFIAISLIGCAAEILRTPTQLNESNLIQDIRIITLDDNVPIRLSSGYSRELKKGTIWQFVGTTKEGDVFKPVDSIFTIEGAHVREAYLAVSGNKLIGFYIPGENSFSPLGSSISLPIHSDGN